MLFAYLGHDARYYQDYLDEATGRMLEAEPDGTYGIRVAPGRHPGLPMPPGDGRWGAPSIKPMAGVAILTSLAPAGEAEGDAPQAAESTVAPEPGPEATEGAQEPPNEPETPPEPQSALPALPGESPGEPAPDGGIPAPSNEEQ